MQYQRTIMSRHINALLIAGKIVHTLRRNVRCMGKTGGLCSGSRVITGSEILGSGNVKFSNQCDFCQNSLFWSHFEPRKHIQIKNLGVLLLTKVSMTLLTQPLLWKGGNNHWIVISCSHILLWFLCFWLVKGPHMTINKQAINHGW